MQAMISLISGVIMGFMPTIDGQRQTLPYIEAEFPYMLGISISPPDLTFITVIQGNTLYIDDYCQGTFDIGVITSSDPVLLYGDGLLQYTIVPELSTICTLLFVTPWLRRKR